MPWKPLKPCKYPGCANLSDQSYCEVHRRAVRAENNRRYDENNRDQNMREFYISTEWRKLRQLKLQKNPMCEICFAEGRASEAVIVDHILPAREYPDRRLDIENLQSVCMSCHSRKTRREEKGRKTSGHEPKPWKF